MSDLLQSGLRETALRQPGTVRPSRKSTRPYFFFTTFFTVVGGATFFTVVVGATVVVVAGATVVVVVGATVVVVAGATVVVVAGAGHDTCFTALGCFKRASMNPSLVVGREKVLKFFSKSLFRESSVYFSSTDRPGIAIRGGFAFL